MTQFSIQWILSLIRLSQKWGQVHYATLTQLQKFFFWLAGQPGYKNLNYSDADYFNLSDKDTRIATAHREQRSPTLEQVKHVIQAMPVDSEIERRNRALIAFALLTVRGTPLSRP